MSEDTRDNDTAEDASTPSKRSGGSEPRTQRKVKVAPVILISLVLILLLLISGGTATWLYFKQYRPEKQTDASVASAVVNAASEGTVALLSYSPETLDKDFAAAKSHLWRLPVVLQQFHRADRRSGGQTKVAQNHRSGVGRRGL